MYCISSSCIIAGIFILRHPKYLILRLGNVYALVSSMNALTIGTRIKQVQPSCGYTQLGFEYEVIQIQGKGQYAEIFVKGLGGQTSIKMWQFTRSFEIVK